MNKTLYMLPLVSLLTTTWALAASSSYNILNHPIGNAANPMLNEAGTPLTGGTAALGDGSIIQLGYFNTSIDDPSAVWTPIAGLGTSGIINGHDLRVGDFSGGFDVGNGFFSVDVTFSDSDTLEGLPTADTQLAVRFYDTTDASSLNTAKFNTVTNANFKYEAFSDPSSGTDIDLASTSTNIWQDSANPFKTTITAVPEPSSFALLGLGGMALLFRRRK